MANGAKVVTLQETEHGYQFVSNRYADAASVGFDVLTELTIDELEVVGVENFTRRDWGELVTSYWEKGGGAEPDRSIVVGVWPDGGIYTC